MAECVINMEIIIPIPISDYTALSWFFMMFPFQWPDRWWFFIFIFILVFIVIFILERSTGTLSY